MSNKWKPFFINKDFLQLYLNKIGVSDYVDIDRIVDLNDISLKRKHKFLFGIAKIKKNFDLKDKISQYNLTNEKSVYIETLRHFVRCKVVGNLNGQIGFVKFIKQY